MVSSVVLVGCSVQVTYSDFPDIVCGQVHWGFKERASILATRLHSQFSSNTSPCPEWKLYYPAVLSLSPGKLSAAPALLFIRFRM